MRVLVVEDEIELAGSCAIATPIVMLTARDAVADRIAGVNAGADDDLVKPFAFGELLARLHTLTGRLRY